MCCISRGGCVSASTSVVLGMCLFVCALKLKCRTYLYFISEYVHVCVCGVSV